MPFDGVEERLNVTLADLIAWLETRDPAEVYDYSDAQDCLLCRYFRDRGYDVTGVDPRDLYVDAASVAERRIPLPPGFNDISLCDRPFAPAGERWTMGEALEFARRHYAL